MDQLFATHHSPDTTFLFFQSQNGVNAKIQSSEGEKGPLPVTLSQEQQGKSFYSLTLRVQQLLLHTHLFPNYGPQSVSFSPLSPYKSWKSEKKSDEVSFPIPGALEEQLLLIHTNGDLSYPFVNTLLTWSCKEKYLKHTSYATTKITALAQDPYDSSLIIGDEKGRLYIKEEWIPFEKSESITQILPLSPHHLLIERGEKWALWNSRSNRKKELEFTEIQLLQEELILAAEEGRAF